MAKFHTSELDVEELAESSDSASMSVRDPAIGDILKQANNLTAEQVNGILQYQVEHGVKFGQAAVALGFVSQSDVLWALSQQFHYPYSADMGSKALNRELVLATDPFSRQAEAFRAIRSQLTMRLFGVDQPRRALAVVSADPQDGKTFFAANVAVALSQLGGRTLVIDADMRNPRLHDVFGVENRHGLSGILSGRAETNVIRTVPDLPSLFVLPVGATPPNPLELAERPAFGLLMKEVLSKFDYVVVDTPAAAYGADGLVISSRCGAALAIARRHRSSLAAMQDMLAAMSTAQTVLAGTVFNEH
jgi:chain length determinant protein tyrosine kinase EpsG